MALTPLLYLPVRALDRGVGYALEQVWRDSTGLVLLRSVLLTAAVTATSLVLGVALAWITTRSALPWRSGWLVVAALPLAIPTYVSAFAWTSFVPQIAGPQGVGAYIVLSACSYPYVLLPVAAALRRADPAGEEVARSLGLTAWQAFRRVTLPQLRPALAAGGLLVGLYVLSDFGAVSIMRFDAFTRVIYNSYNGGFNRTPAAVLGLLLVAVTLVLVWLEGRTRGRAAYARVGAGGARPSVAVRLRPMHRWACTALLSGVALIALGVPMTALVYWTVIGADPDTDYALLLSSAVTSLGVASLGAIATTVLAIPVGVLAARRAGRLPRTLERISYLGHALPGIVVALAMVFLSIRLVPGLYQELPVLVFAYVVLFLPLAVGAVHASTAQSPPALEEVARSTGAGPAAVLRRITLPLAAPGIAAGAVLVFLTCMKELPATLVLRPLGSDTLATRLWTETFVSDFAGAAPFAALLVLLSAVPTYLLTIRVRS